MEKIEIIFLLELITAACEAFTYDKSTGKCYFKSINAGC